ncbi:MAG: HPr family phosphocarrier protein [Clostridia bacterium]|nr:HPr family phosphocarrier protein [Clostridia bacterium]NLF20731.1 HPr family phosphocarrier protein [Clostridiaceae bacterium]
MVKREVIFRCPEDMQMKAVAMLIQKASSFRSNIWLQSGERRANGKSLLGVMSLGIQDQAELEVTAEGPDEDDALETVVAYLESSELS